MRNRTWAWTVLAVPAIAASVGAVLMGVLLMGFARPAPMAQTSANEPGVQVKLAFSYMTPEQVQDLWRRADRYAEAEAFLKKCGQPSNIERRMWQAAGPCIEDVALRKVATYFRSKVLQFGQQKQFVCDTPQAKRILHSVRAKIDSDVEEVRGMCAACIIC